MNGWWGQQSLGIKRIEGRGERKGKQASEEIITRVSPEFALYETLEGEGAGDGCKNGLESDEL